MSTELDNNYQFESPNEAANKERKNIFKFHHMSQPSVRFKAGLQNL